MAVWSIGILERKFVQDSVHGGTGNTRLHFITHTGQVSVRFHYWNELTEEAVAQEWDFTDQHWVIVG